MAKTFQKLARLQMRKLGAGEKLTEHGITFERLSAGDGLFSVNVMVDGVRIHRVIGRASDGTTRTQAEEFIERARTDARHDRLSLARGRKTALSFRDAARDYLPQLEKIGGKAIATKRQHLDQHLVPFFGDTPLSKVESFDVERFKKHRLGQVVQSGGDQRSAARGMKTEGRKTSPGTVNRELATLSHLFSMALEWKWITTAKPKMRRLKEGDGRLVYLTIDQAARFIEATQASDNPQLYPFALIAIETSMRMTEILSIRLEHIDTARRIIYIPKAKAGAREQPMTERVATFLKSYLETSLPADAEWLFPSATSKSGHTVALQKPFRIAAAAAGLDPSQVVRHTLRHTAVSHLVQSGVDLPTVKRISGHKTLAMVERYSHQDGDHIQAAMDKLQERMRAGRMPAAPAHDYTGTTPKKKASA